MKSIRCFAAALLITVSAVGNLFAQAKMRRMPSTINHPSYNVYAPYISADADAIVFLADNTEDNVLTPLYTWRDAGDWKKPEMLPKQIHSRLNFLRGYALSADGRKLYFTTLKTPGVGGFDIWESERKGNTWSEPVNPGFPVNTKKHEACPSVTPDGKALYFMRCDQMDQDKASGCKIFKTVKKSNGQWDEPVALPGNINTGNSQTPRIMADAETLIFSSDQMAGKGGMDLYLTRFSNGNWSTPLPLDFINTEKDDQYVSVAASGRYLIKDAMGSRRNELIEYLIPEEYRPKGMMKIDGKISDPSGNPVPSYISIVDVTHNKRVYSGRPYADGSFMVYLTEGSRYVLAVDPEEDHISYYTKTFDLTTGDIPQIEKISATIKPPEPGDEFDLGWISFKPYSSEVEPAPSTEVQRFMRMVKSNPGLKFEIQVMLKGYMEDSLQSDPDLTEVIYDSIHTTYDDIDTLGQLFQHDTVMVKVTYHNDRTWKQAESVVQYFISQGAGADSFGYFGNAIPAMAGEEKSLVIKALVQQK